MFFLDTSALLFDFGKLTYPLHAICEVSDNNTFHAGVLRGLINVFRAWHVSVYFLRSSVEGQQVIVSKRIAYVMVSDAPLFKSGCWNVSPSECGLRQENLLMCRLDSELLPQWFGGDSWNLHETI